MQYRFELTSLGAPGAGKGTLSSRLAKKCAFVHFAVGDVLRQITTDPVIEYVDEYNVLPSGRLFEIFNDMFKAFSWGLPVVVDGFPRSLAQAREFEKIVSFTGRAKHF